MKRRTLLIPALASILILYFFLLQNVHADLPGHVANYWNKVNREFVQCKLCPRNCMIADGQRGACTVRINKGGILYTLGYGNPVSLAVDPIEKKPFFHVEPGSPVFSLAVAGCNMRCLFCQNWQISQSKPDEVDSYKLNPEEVVDVMIKNRCKYIAYTYTEPVIFYEYMLDIAKIAKKKGLKNTMHTCGYVNQEPLAELLKYMDAVNVDLKAFDDKFYNKMGMMAQLGPVLETIKTVKKQGVWLEITNLLIPGENDDPREIRKMCVWIKENVGDEVPLHFSRFMPTFRLTNLPPTPAEKLKEARKIAMETGLKYVYIGNAPGYEGEDTYCPNCGKVVVKRRGYSVEELNIKGGRCKFCDYKIAGIWGDR
ncbi:MAG: AmmeMemoRadiSam system radical SAM enzyme [Candidatus Omnitrophica bacterium]|nr:AmmeMemoRadiSam system radical SAM enzyme [Candidatus Omnitrophota bacterium]